MTTIYVAIQSETPMHSADTLQAAQGDALARHTQYLPAENYSFRWDEYAPGVWRLMSRHKDRKGRYSWTGRAVHAVEHVTA
ncbi:hypothetical protein [Streptomyces sp. NPDC056049]|uniref:hypothetical protein n=1 Tax=Streptomyces sp. NPDC056049 TaxID=3345693 RepID=UPI0035D73D44